MPTSRCSLRTDTERAVRRPSHTCAVNKSETSPFAPLAHAYAHAHARSSHQRRAAIHTLVVRGLLRGGDRRARRRQREQHRTHGSTPRPSVVTQRRPCAPPGGGGAPPRLLLLLLLLRLLCRQLLERQYASARPHSLRQAVQHAHRHGRHALGPSPTVCAVRPHTPTEEKLAR